MKTVVKQKISLKKINQKKNHKKNKSNQKTKKIAQKPQIFQKNLTKKKKQN